MKHLFIVFILLFAQSQFSQSTSANETIEKYKEEIKATELAFVEMVKTDGLKAAFVHFAANDGVIMRGDTIYRGKDGIGKHVGKRKTDFNFFTWYPDFIDVSSSGDLGYTYGKYQFEYVDKDKKLQTGSGIFHTVWKRQANGQWRYVWD